jgi:Xaa-Pro aminopeptidase
MKTELDELMQQQSLDAILVTGNGQHNPAMVYLTGGAHMTPELVKRRGAGPLLFCHAMERDEAARTGLETRSLADYPIEDFLAASEGDYVKALALRYKQILEDAEVRTGRIALYGRGEVGSSYAVLSCLQELMPHITLVGEVKDTVLQKAMFTKDPDEIDRLRQVGQISCEVFDETADFLASHRARDGILINQNDQPLTIGGIKNRIDLWLAERGLENPHGAIFSTGRDTAVPHSAGKADDVLRLGQPLVFDLFPCEKGGGYFHDMTRTWCLGYAPDEFMALYENVSDVFNQVRQALTVGVHCRIYQEMACDLFEKMGHPTLKTDPKTEQGFVHGLGHGVGLNIHERPWFNATASAEDCLVPGVVFTLEPGLYYPDRGMGVRLEDTFWVNPAGIVDSLTMYPFSPVISLKK